MNPFRPLALLWVFPVIAGGLCAQAPRPPLPAANQPAETALDEVYTPEPARPAAASAAAPASARVEPKGTEKVAPTALPGAGSKLPAGGPPPLSPRFQQVRNRIDALFQHRGEAPLAPDPRKSPFRPAGAAPVAAVKAGPAANVPPPTASAADLQLLKQASATLKVAGTIQINSVAHLIINQVPYKEGDVINLRAKGQPVFVRVKHISRYSYTLALNAAELSVKY